MIPSTTSYSPDPRPTAQRATPDGSASASAGSISTSIPDDAAAAKQQSASDALNALRDIADSGPRERKAQAEEKLKRLKEEMTQLMRWGFASGPMAQRSLQLAKELGAAATQFTDAISKQAGMASSSAEAQASSTPVDSSTAADTATNEVQSALPQAYRDIMSDAPSGKSLSVQDQETLADFRGATQQLTFMLEDSARKLQKDGHSTAFIDPGKRVLAGIDARMAGMEGKVAILGLPGGADTAPVSLIL
ncbi:MULTISPECIES: hypothetical protein [unclassified Rhizobium]|uniref:hypothetical protein n=1 Tax=unclassified Rhizobium TaxID=2613769 RepID=UPI000713587E|nr:MULTISPECIES: hypothetical protein [unclassified Rhizobium]KQS97894.1 hypothetical protein ASG50_22115 [Rhizobium sp. Leaf386]KQT00152.1 hypothetical protein ASG42_04710 [Rhizobium sp. Leaf391]KQT97158.1 hypothetical protein ASG68_09435 [Rhizobium sp. Leaf453]